MSPKSGKTPSDKRDEGLTTTSVPPETAAVEKAKETKARKARNSAAATLTKLPPD